MTSLKDFANAYESKQMKNIADLKVVSTDTDIQTETRDGKDGSYIVSFIIVDNEEYRVANTVIEQLKAILEQKSNLKTFKVNKTGTGMGTKYQVIALD